MTSAAFVYSLFHFISFFNIVQKLMRQIKQVRGVNDVDIDDIEASAPPSEEVRKNMPK